MRVNDSFDFSRINIFAAGDDHVLQPIKNVEVSVCVLISNVARSEEAVSEREFSFFRLVPITAHDIRASSDQLACLPGLTSFPVGSTTCTSIPRQGRPQEVSLSSVCS